MSKCYSELIKLPTFADRFRYLKIGGKVGAETFGSDRYLNQRFYNSNEWKRLRDYIIVRDNGCDLGVEGRDILDRIIIHHINPISEDDILHHTDALINPEYLICVSDVTHNAIHYGDESILYATSFANRYANDTCPWKVGSNV